MVTIPLVWLSTLSATSQAAPSFAEIEKKKYEALAQLSSFSGTYEVVSIPREGAGIKQSVTLLFAEEGRKATVVANGLPQIESVWTKSERWSVIYPQRTYSQKSYSQPMPLTEPYVALPSEAGSVNFAMDQTGVRFAASPEPKLDSTGEESVEGKPTTRYTFISRNTETGGEMKLTQWFDSGGWLLRKFELALSSRNGPVATIRGNLVKDTTTPEVSATSFRIPDSVRASFTRTGT